jgi:hypothetical protein
MLTGKVVEEIAKHDVTFFKGILQNLELAGGTTSSSKLSQTVE